MNRLEERGVLLTDAYRVLEYGSIVGGPQFSQQFGDYELTMRGKTLDGEDLDVVVALDLSDELIQLITAH